MWERITGLTGGTWEGWLKTVYRSSISSKEYVHSYTHSSSHQPPTRRISDKSAKLASYSSFLFYLLLLCPSSFQFAPFIFDNNFLFCMSLLFMLSRPHVQWSEACLLWILLVVRLPRSFSHCQLSAVGRRRTEDGITKICRSSSSLLAGWSTKQRPIIINGVVVVQPLAQAPYNTQLRSLTLNATSYKYLPFVPASCHNVVLLLTVTGEISVDLQGQKSPLFHHYSRFSIQNSSAAGYGTWKSVPLILAHHASHAVNRQ